jgi:cell division protein FtsW
VPPSAPPGRVAGTGGDGSVALSSALLATVGVVMIYSATAPLAMGEAFPPLFLRHLAGLGVGFAALLAARRVPLAWWRSLSLPLWCAATVALVLTLAVGLEAKGAQRWLALPLLGRSFQPAELAKWATPLTVAAVLAGRRPGDHSALAATLVLTAVPVGLLLLQPDFGSAAVLALLVGTLLFVAGLPLRPLGALAGVGALGAGAYVALNGYALERVRGFLQPWQTASDQGFQLVQSFVAFGRGGTLGVGLGGGRQKLSYLPEAHTDFILSVVAEEVGLVGVLCVLGLFAALAASGLRVARRAREPFAAYTAFLMTAFVALPAVVNAAVVMGLLPTTGFTLPFLSFGSNSLVFCCLSVGVLLRVAAHEASSRAPAGPTARTGRRRPR